MLVSPRSLACARGLAPVGITLMKRPCDMDLTAARKLLILTIQAVQSFLKISFRGLYSFLSSQSIVRCPIFCHVDIAPADHRIARVALRAPRVAASRPCTC